MTRKHYRELAEELAWLLGTAGTAEERQGMVATIKVLAASLKAENRAFDRERFFTACGL